MNANLVANLGCDANANSNFVCEFKLHYDLFKLQIARYIFL